jgi:hypothetical protein
MWQRRGCTDLAHYPAQLAQVKQFVQYVGNAEWSDLLSLALGKVAAH